MLAAFHPDEQVSSL